MSQLLTNSKFGLTQLANDFWHFSLYAPKAQNVWLKLINQNIVYKLEKEIDGFWGIQANAKTGEHYFYSIDEIFWFPDPASKYQPQDVHGPSQIIDTEFNWQVPSFKAHPWHESIIYELHVGAFSPQGNFLSIIPELDRLKKLGINTIELMPVNDFPGQYNWGYDGVQLFAPDSNYGTPQDLKTFIDAAHQLEIQVLTSDKRPHGEGLLISKAKHYANF